MTFVNLVPYFERALGKERYARVRESGAYEFAVDTTASLLFWNAMNAANEMLVAGYSFEKSLETNRSMKHYFFPTEAYQGTLDKVKMFAPFNGTVSAITSESDEIGKPGKRPSTGNAITFSTTTDKNVGFQFAHIYFVKDFKISDEVKAGDLIGYAALGDKGNDFDIVLSGTKQTTQPIFGSLFDHMSAKVLAEFAKYGVTPDNTKITKEYRDAHPCNFNTSQAQGRNDENWIQLKH